jgi:DNA polymerase elongation subunit (family B)
MRSTIIALYNDRVPIEQIGLTKTVKAKYANENLPQARVAQKKRDRGEDVRSNDRVTWVVLADTPKASAHKRATVAPKTGIKKVSGKVGDRVEDIEYYTAHRSKLKLDYGYYINNQLYQPMQQLLGIIIPEKQFNEMIAQTQQVEERRLNGIAKRAFFDKFMTTKK